MTDVGKEGYWYLATPYTLYDGGKYFAFCRACRVAAELMSQGFAVVSPIAYAYSITAYGLAGDGHDVWLPTDLAVLRKAKGLFVLDGPWIEDSFGMQEEIKLAEELGLPIIYLSGERYQ